AVNVEAQNREPSSLLDWTRRILAVRKAHKAFGRGTLEFLHPGNRKILAYIRQYEDETLLCVGNLKRSAQAVELDLRRFKGCVPIELMGGAPFPPVGDLPYLLTLTGYGFYWFKLASEAAAPSWHEEFLASEPPPWLVLFDSLASFTARGDGERQALVERLIRHLENDVLPGYLVHQRWFAAKNEQIESVRLKERCEWPTDRDRWLLSTVELRFERGEEQIYF